MAAGAAVGSVVPGIGTVIGLIIGAGVGITAGILVARKIKGGECVCGHGKNFHKWIICSSFKIKICQTDE